MNETYYIRVMGKANIPERLEIGHKGCCEWQGSVNMQGYAIYNNKYVHRLVYAYHFGVIPVGLVIDHICRNRRCVNPKHLRAVSRIVNCMENSIAPFAINAKKTHCPQGHEYTVANTYWHSRKGRMSNRDCKLCTLRRNTKFRRNTKYRYARK